MSVTRKVSEVEWQAFPEVKPNPETKDHWLCVSTPESLFSQHQVAEWNGENWLGTDGEIIADKVTFWTYLPASPEELEKESVQA